MEKGLVAGTLQEALEWLDREEPAIYAGGTDLMINKKFSKLLIQQLP